MKNTLDIFEQEVKYYNYKDFDYRLLRKIKAYTRRSKYAERRYTVAELYAEADTETSKSSRYGQLDLLTKSPITINYVCCWSLCLIAPEIGIVCLWGRTPKEYTECLNNIRKNITADKVYIYFHYLGYDHVFLRAFEKLAFGEPIQQLNTDSMYPVIREYENGLCIRDSLILANCSLNTWGKQLDVPHKKAVGKWDYSVQRDYNYKFSDDEFEYFTVDVICGAECLYKLAYTLGLHLVDLPLTSTGIVRRACRKAAEKGSHDDFVSMAPFYSTFKRLSEETYSGGYTHANRFEIGYIHENVKCFDFVSSYPFVMLSEKYACEEFQPLDHGLKVEEALKMNDDYCYITDFLAYNIRLKDANNPMPYLQYSKIDKTVGHFIMDNGRIVAADAIRINSITDVTLALLNEYYEWEDAACINIEYAKKDYLPKWFRDFVFKCYEDKCMLKHGDKATYSLAKSRLNALYGMCVQSLPSTILELQEDLEEQGKAEGQYIKLQSDREELYIAHLNNQTSLLNYAWGVWITEYAKRNLFELGKCTASPMDWLYSDTDSVMSDKWIDEEVEAYNNKAKQKLIDAGYGPVVLNGEEFWLGLAEFDDDKGIMTQFVSLGSKRYAYVNDSGLHITVAGVPKKEGAKALKDIKNFHKGFIFKGEETGKLLHKYYFSSIIKEEDGCMYADYVDLTPADYDLGEVERCDPDFEDFNIDVFLARMNADELGLVIADGENAGRL